MSELATPIPQSLWTDVCPTCGYSIHGLPTEGICPECGGKYDQSEIVLYGYGRGKHERLATAKPSRIGGVIFFMIANWLGVGFTLLFHQYGLALIAGGSALSILIGLAPRKRTNHPGLVQVRLNSTGVVQYNDLSAPDILMEYFCRYGWLGLLVIIVALVFLYRLLFDGLANFGITITFLLAGEIYLLGVARRFNRAVAEVRDGKAVSFNAAWNKRKLWRAVGMFTLECIDGDFWRLCINPPPVSLWKPWTPYSAVDIEFKCTTARANELRELMREWKREADQQHEAAEKIKLLTSIK